ncbi:predicted protein, partial [Nematostella vectensis]
STDLVYTEGASYAQAISLIIMVICGSLGNGFVSYTIQHSKALQNTTFAFILSLAVANLGALLLCAPFPIITSIARRYILGRALCHANGFLNNLFFCASIFTLALIALHKYSSVVRPLNLAFLLTARRAKSCLVAVWAACASMSLLALGPFSGWKYIVFNPTTVHCGIAFPHTVTERIRMAGLSAVAFIIPLGLMIYAYLRIYFKVSAHERRLTHTRPNVSQLKRKLTVTLCLMFGTFVACWTPFFVLFAVALCVSDASDLPPSLGRVAYWCGYLNCCLNPALYCFRTTAFKE